MTLVLTARDVETLVTDLNQIFEALEVGFHAERHPAITGQRVRSDLPAAGTATVLFPGLLDGVPAYTVKVNAKFPAARPALRGVVCLHSLEDGSLLALLDSASVTAWRTGLAAAIATDLLARKDATEIGVVGAGAQGRMLLHGLAALREISHVRVHDQDAQRAASFLDREVRALGLRGERASLADVAHASQIVLLATWAREPLLGRDDTHDGQHLTTIGADEPGKQELAADLLEDATLVVDDRELVAQMGATANAGCDDDAINATLTEVLRGTHPGRTSDREITVYAPVGLPWQDLALAWCLYQRAQRAGLGSNIDLLGEQPR